MNFEHLIAKATQLSKQKIAIASAEDIEVLGAVAAALKIGLAEFLLFGNKIEIEGILKEKHPDLLGQPGISIFDTGTKEEAAAAAVKAVRDQEAGVLMKGNLSTSILLKAVLNKDLGLRSGKILSHVAVFEVPGYENLLLLTDAAMNIAPQLEQKAEIIRNAVKIAESIGIKMPKVAPLAAVETINNTMSATLDAASLTEMNRRGQITNCIVDGPLALDIAVSKAAAEHKGIKSEVAGNADILLVPAIEVGNVLYKSLIYFANAKVGAVIAGATAPIVLTSRADTAESKLYSLALAVCTAPK
ncbi:phosphate butyryltransferase [Mesobacillus persicus]|uniref:Phosphate butyryltransferase n=1 Tax=Mesobacillus persicus TaxID=930146 RepID=A0A1H8BZK1_9BACI|nr:phosphate butyryltransferase [Mesobacillus persicus]SEM88213.1 phosphate butyryltransferase [Mesobacillus persicus]